MRRPSAPPRPQLLRIRSPVTMASSPVLDSTAVDPSEVGMMRHDVRSPELSETSEFTASVLIIEDDTHVRSLYGRQLSGPTVSAGEVTNAETIPAASGRPRGYAAVLLDVDIPDVVRAALPEAAAAAGADGPV